MKVVMLFICTCFMIFYYRLRLKANLAAQASILALVQELIVDFTTWPCGAVD